MKSNNPPAFPTIEDNWDFFKEKDMTLQECFAFKIMQDLISKIPDLNYLTPDEVAKEAILIVDEITLKRVQNETV